MGSNRDWGQYVRRGASSVGTGWMLLGLAVVIAAGFRLYGLADESLWNDELSTWSRQDEGPFSALFWERMFSDVHPPGYLLLMSAWCAVFGESEVALRLPSALAGIAAVPAVFVCGRRVYSELAGLVAAFLTAASPFLIEYSQEARSFAFVTLLGILAAGRIYALLTAEPELRGGWRQVSSAAFAAAACAYLHYSGLLLVVTLYGFAFVQVLIWDRRRWPIVAASAGLALLLYAPWLAGLVHHLARGGVTFLARPNLQDLFQLPAQLLPTYVFAAAATFIGGVVAARSEAEVAGPGPSERLGGALLLWTFLVLVLGFFGKSIVSTPIFSAKYLIVATPVLVLLVAGAIGRARVRARAVALWTAIVVCLMATDLLYVQGYYSKQQKEDFRGAAAVGAEWLSRLGPVPIIAHAWSARYFEYYLRAYDLPLPLLLRATSGGQLRKLARKLADSPTIIILAGHKKLKKADLKKLAPTLEVVDFRQLRGAAAALLERRN
jgi:mannosyltransferase